MGTPPYGLEAHATLEVSITTPRLPLPTVIILENVRSRTMQSMRYKSGAYVKAAAQEILVGDVVNSDYAARQVRQSLVFSIYDCC